MKKTDLNNKSMALLLWKKSPSNEDEVSMYCGVLKIKNKSLVFERIDSEMDFVIQNEWVDRVKKTPEILRQELGNSDYQLSLTVSEYEGGFSYKKTGLKWIG